MKRAWRSLSTSQLHRISIQHRSTTTRFVWTSVGTLDLLASDANCQFAERGLLISRTGGVPKNLHLLTREKMHPDRRIGGAEEKNS